MIQDNEEVSLQLSSSLPAHQLILILLAYVLKTAPPTPTALNRPCVAPMGVAILAPHPSQSLSTLSPLFAQK